MKVELTFSLSVKIVRTVKDPLYFLLFFVNDSRAWAISNGQLAVRLWIDRMVDVGFQLVNSQVSTESWSKWITQRDVGKLTGEPV